MSTSGSLVVMDPRIDPSRYFNLSTNTSHSIKTPGGRTEAAINSIYYAEQASRIGMIVVVQHTNCASSTGDVEANVRADIQILKNSPYVRNDIAIIGYVLDLETGQLREVKYVEYPYVFQSPVLPLVWHSVGRSTSRGFMPGR